MAQAEADHRHDFDIDLNTAREDELARLPILGRERAAALVRRRPFKTWGEVIAIRGIDGGIVSALRDGGARLGFATAPDERDSNRDWHGVDAEPETG